MEGTPRAKNHGGKSKTYSKTRKSWRGWSRIESEVGEARSLVHTTHETNFKHNEKSLKGFK